MKKLLLNLLIFSFFTFLTASYACTDFRIMAKDGTILITRSMEFAVNFKSNIRSSNRGRLFNFNTPDGKPALSWKAKYGYVFLDGLNHDFTVDGMNENGLSFEYLYLPGETQYQTIPAGKENQALPYISFGDWVLSNFKTVDEVRNALSNLYVFETTIPDLGSIIFPLHASIFDASGKGIVVEFVQGKMNVYGNMGVLTNSPTYNWHIVQLRNYLNLSPFNPKPVTVNGMTFSATGQGAGMVGLPGDVSPPSRFVKIAFMLHSVYPVNDAMGALNLGEHLINNVDIPTGLARSVDKGKESTDQTEWVVFKDLTHKKLYYRTYDNMTLRAIALDKINFAENAPRLKMPMESGPYILDVNNQFLNAKSS